MSKTIVLCADGTGNRGGVTRGTNVYRMAKAIDIHGDVGTALRKQVSFYLDGVGTDSAKILKIVGGAFGFGLSANIRLLYHFLVRNYEDGDDIYLFGFSRGAYTARSFAQMVATCGLVRNDCYRSARELDALVGEAYSAHRSSQKKDDPADAAAFKQRCGRDTQAAERFPGRGYGPKDIPIKFVGVWDTVGAIGLPFDELTDSFDRFFGFKFKRLQLHPLIEHGRQALAIDEERHTFHPVLWDERDPADWQTLEQVWFPGVHSNVGGGYPKDDLAHVSLVWMMDQARAVGAQGEELRYVAGRESAYRASANAHGRMYDSRSGAAVYYRYRPRNIRALAAELIPGDPKVHVSTLARIGRGTAGYAPAAIPPSYELVEAYDPPPETDPEERNRCLVLARDVVWWRRVLYYGFLATSLAFVVRAVGLSETVQQCRVDWPFLGWIFVVFDWSTPAFADPIISNLRDHPFTLFVFVALAGLLLFLRGRWMTATRALATAGWKRSLGHAWTKPSQKLSHRIARWMRRRSWIARQFLPWFKGSFLPLAIPVAAVALLAWGGYAYFQSAWGRVAGSLAEGDCCVARPLLAGTEAVVEDFAASTPCFETRHVLLAGETYTVSVQTTQKWKDGAKVDDEESGIPASPAGLTADETWIMSAFRPLLRAKGRPYMLLMAGLACDEGETFEIGAGPTTITPTQTGTLFFFANDVTCYLCPGGAWQLYENNRGGARITVRHLSSERRADAVAQNRDVGAQ